MKNILVYNKEYQGMEKMSILNLSHHFVVFSRRFCSFQQKYRWGSCRQSGVQQLLRNWYLLHSRPYGGVDVICARQITI